MRAFVCPCFFVETINNSFVNRNLPNFMYALHFISKENLIASRFYQSKLENGVWPMNVDQGNS